MHVNSDSIPKHHSCAFYFRKTQACVRIGCRLFSDNESDSFRSESGQSKSTLVQWNATKEVLLIAAGHGN